MKCLNCKKDLTSGILWGRMGDKYQSKSIDLNTFKSVPMEIHKIVRMFGFCDKKCEEDFFLDKRWFDKKELSLRARLISRDEVIEQLEKASLASDNEDEKDLIYILRRSI